MLKIGKSKGYTFLSALEHVYSEIVKFGGIKSNPLQEPNAKHKDRRPDKLGSINNQFTIFYLHIAYQHEQQQEHQHLQRQQRQKITTSAKQDTVNWNKKWLVDLPKKLNLFHLTGLITLLLLI